MSILTEHDINNRIINNDALFNNIYVINQKFDILPNDKMHYGNRFNDGLQIIRIKNYQEKLRRIRSFFYM